MAYSYRSTSLLPGSKTWNEVQAEIIRQEQEEAREQEKQERVKQLNDDSKTTRAQLKIIREQQEQQEQQLRERKAQQEQQLREQQARLEQREQQELQKYLQQIKQELQQLPRHTHQEPSLFTNVGNSVRRCLTATGECLEGPEIKKQREREQREREEKLRRDERNKQEDRDYLDEYDREHPPSNWDDTEEQRQKMIKVAEKQRQKPMLIKAYLDALRNLESAKQAAAIVDSDEESRRVRRVRLEVAAAEWAAAKAAVDKMTATEVAEAESERIKKQRAAELERRKKQHETELARLLERRDKYGYQGGRKTKKIKHRHHKKSLRHHKKSLRHHKKSLRHRKKSLRHHKKSLRHRKKSMKHHNKY
jgi:hypothetical protein